MVVKWKLDAVWFVCSSVWDIPLSWLLYILTGVVLGRVGVVLLGRAGDILRIDCRCLLGMALESSRRR